MVAFDNIQEKYIRKAALWGESEITFPLPLTRDDNGGYHLEINENGKMSLIATERGNINDKMTTESLDELMYWVFKMRSKAKGLQFEAKNRVETQDFRRLYFSKSVEEISKIPEDWAKRLQEEFEEILSEHPFVDDL